MSRRVEKALGGVDGVREASVNLATEKATMVFDPAHTGLEAMKQAVEEAGYGLVEPEVAPDEGGIELASDPVRRNAVSTRRLRAKAMFAVPLAGLILLLSVAGAIPAIGGLCRQRASDLAAGYAGPVLGRLAILRRRVVGDTPSQREHAHSDCRGHQRSLPV